MGVLTYLRKVYDLDTLDTRFTSSSSTPYQTVIDARGDPVEQKEAEIKARSSAPPSKWRTPEFFLYYLVFIVVVPYMFWIAYDVSKREKRIPLLAYCHASAVSICLHRDALTACSFRPAVPQVREISV
jgi:hypothetical protein